MAFFFAVRNYLLAKISSSKGMIDHLGSGQRFVDLLRLAPKIDQELHTVGLNVAVFAPQR
ncbi:MAG TPA: hypothetical protein VGK77_00480 [Candidatus Binatia bacterium]